MAAAAVVLAVLLIGGLLALVSGGSDSSTPANDDGSNDSSSSENVFADENLLGPVVEVEKLTIDGKPAVHEAVLSDTSGKGPSLCDRVTTLDQSSGGGSCTSREPNADDESVAFDWLSGTSGSGDIRGVLAGVDKRAMKVQIWMDNGDMTLADLKPGTWEDTKLFGFTVPADGPRPQRLVAYSDASGTFLQAIDIQHRFGDDWLPGGGKTCAGDVAATWHEADAGGTGDVSVVLWSGSAKVTAAEADTVGSACLELGPGPLGGSTNLGGNLVVAVVAPEVQSYRVEGEPAGLQADMYSVTGTPWRVVVATVPEQATFADAQLVLLDSSERELAREYLSQPASP